MAITLTGYPNTDTSNPTAYPNGIIKDDPGDGTGTPVNKLVYADYHMFFDKLLRMAALLSNNLPDNETNGYQYVDALKSLFGYNAWQAGPALTFAAPSGGGISGGTVSYNKYRILGKTLMWQVKITGMTITGTPSLIVCNSPNTSGSNYPNDSFEFYGIYVNAGAKTNMVCILNGPTASGQISFVCPSGFSAGSANQDFHFQVIAELP